MREIFTQLIRTFLRTFGCELLKLSQVNRCKNLKPLNEQIVNQPKLIKLLNKLLNKLGASILKISPELAVTINPKIYRKAPKQIDFKIEKIDPIIIAGYGATGSSAVLNFLEDYDECLVPDPGIAFEFRLIKDPGGLIDLEATLIDNYIYYNAASSIKRFKTQANVHAKRFFSYGFNVDKITEGKFSKFVEEYIDKLVVGYYDFSWHCDDLDKSRFIQSFKNLIRIKNEKILQEQQPIVIRDKDKFLNHTKIFLNKTFMAMGKYEIEKKFWWKAKEAPQIPKILLDQGLSPENADKGIRYFSDDARVIIVDRDPRDTYISSVTYNHLFPNDVELFAKNYLISFNLTQKQKDPRIMKVMFEDFVNNKDNLRKKILNFVNLSEKKHEDWKFTLFDENFSKTKIRKWETQNLDEKLLEDVHRLKQLLPDHCLN